MTFVCEHLAENSHQAWCSSEPDDANRWPDAWCDVCDEAFMREGEWNEKNEGALEAKILCHHCYERRRADATENRY